VERAVGVKGKLLRAIHALYVNGKARVKGWTSIIRTVWCAQRCETGMYLIPVAFQCVYEQGDNGGKKGSFKVK